MVKPIIACLSEGALMGSGLVLMYWISGRRLAWEGAVFFIAFGMLGIFLTSIPSLRLESSLLQLLKASGPEGQKVKEALDREIKKQSITKWLMRPISVVAFLCLLGLLSRFFQ